MSQDQTLKKICGIAFILMGFFGFWGVLIVNAAHSSASETEMYLMICIALALFFGGWYIVTPRKKMKRH